MSKSIWKFELKIDTDFTIEMPKGASVLSAQAQKETICIWAIVDTEAEKEKRTFEVYGTGHDLPSDIEKDRMLIGTVQLMGGALIFHVFEKLN